MNAALWEEVWVKNQELFKENESWNEAFPTEFVASFPDVQFHACSQILQTTSTLPEELLGAPAPEQSMEGAVEWGRH